MNKRDWYASYLGTGRARAYRRWRWRPWLRFLWAVATFGPWASGSLWSGVAWWWSLVRALARRGGMEVRCPKKPIGTRGLFIAGSHAPCHYCHCLALLDQVQCLVPVAKRRQPLVLSQAALGSLCFCMPGSFRKYGMVDYFCLPEGHFISYFEFTQ